jgi:hypothetical protein
MKIFKSTPALKFTVCLLTILLSFNSCVDDKTPRLETKQEINFNEIQALIYKKGKTIFLPCCICVIDSPNNPCPCGSCSPFPKDLFPEDILSSTINLKIKDHEENNLALSNIKTNDTIFLKDSRAYKWVGLLHNEILSRTLVKMEGPILKWKEKGKRPGNKEVENTIVNALLKTYKEIGVSGDYYALMEKFTQENISETKEISTGNEKLTRIFKLINADQKVNEIKRAIDLEESILTNSFRKSDFKDFYCEKVAFSVFRASNDFWTEEKINSLHLFYTGKPYVRPVTGGTVEKAKDVVIADAAGAAVGAIGGIPGGPAGIAAGALSKGCIGSTGAAVKNVLDWLFD